jgi:hypothetical protein
VLVIGTVGFRIIAGTDWVDSFYFESMLATGQGPPFPLTTDDAKLFASAMAFISVGSVVTAIFFTLGPILARFWRESLEFVEEGARELEHGVRKAPKGREGPTPPRHDGPPPGKP